MSIIKTILDIVKTIAPLAAVAFAILVSWGVVKWSKRLNGAVKGMSESPITFIFMIGVIVACLFIYFKYLAPIIHQV